MRRGSSLVDFDSFMRALAQLPEQYRTSASIATQANTPGMSTQHNNKTRAGLPTPRMPVSPPQTAGDISELHPRLVVTLDDYTKINGANGLGKKQTDIALGIDTVMTSSVNFNGKLLNNKHKHNTNSLGIVLPLTPPPMSIQVVPYPSFTTSSGGPDCLHLPSETSP